MSVIATLLPQAKLQRVRGAVGDREDLAICDNWAALHVACERLPVRVAIIDLFTTSAPSFGDLRRLKQQQPRLAILCYVGATDNIRAIFDAGRAGVDGLIIAGQSDSPVELVRAIAGAESRALAAVLRRSLRGTDSVVYDAVMIAVSRAHERLTPLRLAQLLGVPRRTLSDRLSRAGFPSPKRLLAWGRLIVAAQLLEDRHRSADRIAASLEFPSGSAFRNTCQRYLHATPSQIRTRGGAEYVLRTWFRQMRDARAPSMHPVTSRRRLALAV